MAGSWRGLMAAAVAIVLLATACGRSRSDGSRPEVSQRGPGLNRRSPDALQLPVPRTFDLTHVDPVHFAAALGHDPVRLFEFVRDEIAYEAYRGVLRGPRGTLLARAGNSADRAGLLASLLKAAGQRVRFARGTLPEREARELVTSMWAVKDTTLTKPEARDTLRATSATFARAAQRDYSLIRTLLKDAKLPSPVAMPSLDSLVAEARSHYWVQWARDGRWEDLDPLFRETNPGRASTRAEEVLDDLPEAAFHRVLLRVTLEEYKDDVADSRPILTYEAKAADLSAVAVLLAHVPELWQGPAESVEAALSAAIQDTGRVKPVLAIGGQVVTGDAFLQKPRTGGIGGIRTMLGRREPIASAYWVEFVLVAPDGTRQTVVREIFDRVGPARRKAGQRLDAGQIRSRAEARDAVDVTNTVYGLFFTTGGVDPQHLAEVADAQAAEGLDDIAAALRRTGVAFAAISDGLLSRMASTRATIRFYPDAPRVSIAEMSGGASFRVALDLRRERVRAVAAGGTPETLFAATMLRGVVQGTLERVLLEHLIAETQKLGPAQVATLSTSALFDRAVAERIPILLLPRDRSRLDGTVPPDVVARLDEAAAAGHLAIAPQRTVSIGGAQRFAWWQVDPRSGETIAVTDEGLHQVTSEVTMVRSKDGKWVELSIVRYHGPPGGLGRLPPFRSYLRTTLRRGSGEFRDTIRWLLSEGRVNITTLVP